MTFSVGFRFTLVALPSLILGFACSSSSDEDPEKTPNSGGKAGATSSAGSSNKGGSSSGGTNASSGGSGGTQSSGGTSSSGGTTSQGGRQSSGGSSAQAGTSNAGSGGAAEQPCTPGTGTTDVDADSVRDNATCLIWQKKRGVTKNWDETNKYCQGLEQSGFSDWRMPSAQELLTWPGRVEGDALLTSPRYIKPTDSDPAGSFHVCAVSYYADKGCNWWGPANATGTICVRGTGSSLPPLNADCQTDCTNKIKADGYVEWNP
jgi:hypothetical protein